MIRISHQTKSIVLPFRQDVATLLPSAIRFQHNGLDLMTVRHGVDETRLLQNLGIKVTPPIMEHYNFPSSDGRTAFIKQIQTSASMTMNRRSYVLNEMGTGKTKSCLWAFDYLKREGKANRMLVVATLSTLNFTWAKEIMNTLPHLTVRVLTGSADRREKLLKDPADIYIINHDGLGVIWKALTTRADIDVICFDEVAVYRNARARRSKIAKALATNRAFVWGMTGSPTPSEPTDAYGLATLITPDTAPRSWTRFREETMLKVSQFKWVPRRNSDEVIARVLQPAVRFRLDEIVELPPVIVRDVEVPLTPRQEIIYKRLKNDAAVALKEGNIVGINGGAVFQKLLQVGLGWAYGEGSRQVIEIDNKPRVETLVQLVQEAQRKVIIFSPFKAVTAGIDKILHAEGIDYATVTGDTTPKERGEIFNAYQNTAKYRVLNAHPECMSHGLTLTAADTIIWFGPTTKLETYEQANARITRVGQSHKQQIIRLIGTPLEQLIYNRLAKKQDFQMSILEIIEELTAGEG